MFLMQAGFSLIMPFLPLYVSTMDHLYGISVELWTGAIFSASFIMAAFALPYWGSIADRFGRRRMMIRASFSVGVVMAAMGLATQPWHLVVLRMLQGTQVGFLPAATAYLMSITPKEKTGYALGIFQTAATGAVIIGPLLGGILASFVGYRHVFFFTGGSCITASLICALFLKEQFVPEPGTSRGRLREDLRTVARTPVLMAMMVVVLVQNFSVFNAEPIIPLFLQTLQTPAYLLSFLSGLVFSIVGVAGIIATPYLGRQGDRIGYKKVLLIALAGAGAMYLLQGAAQTWWLLLIFRFGQGCFVGGVLASANSLIAFAAPAKFQARAFSVSSASMQIGNFLGPLMGGAVATVVGFRLVFPITGLLCLLNLLWVWRVVPDQQPGEAPAELPAR